MGKYSKFKDSMVSYVGEQKHQDKVEREKERILDGYKQIGIKGGIKDIATTLLHARLEKARLEALLKSQNLTIEATSQMMLERMEDDTMASVKLDNNVSMSIKDDVYCSVSDKTAFLTWVKETGQEDLLTVNYQTMSSIVKQRLTGVIEVPEGEEVTPPGVSTFFKQSITVRGVKNLEQDDE